MTLTKKQYCFRPYLTPTEGFCPLGVGPLQEVCLLSPNAALQQLEMVFGQVYLQAEIKRYMNNGLMLNTGSVITSRLYLLYRLFQFISKRIYGIDMLFEKQMMS